jgi:transposase InsO family protein
VNASEAAQHGRPVDASAFPSQPLAVKVLRRLVESAQYLSIRSTERLAEAGAVTSVGSRGGSYDNALAETIIGLYKTELIRRCRPWKGIDQVEYATLEWVDWFTTGGSWSPSATSRRQSSKPHSTERRTPATLLDSSTQASDEPGAVHSLCDPTVELWQHAAAWCWARSRELAAPP